MVNISGASATGNRTRGARWVGYTAFGWALLFSLMHLYWGIEASTTGRLTVPGGAITAGGRVDGSAWVAYAVILCIMGVLVALLRFRGEGMTRRTQLAVVGSACTAMTAYVVYAFTANDFQWLIAPGVLCAAAAVIALALIQPWGASSPAGCCSSSLGSVACS